MTSELEIGLYIFILAGFLGYHVITRVPPLLHAPLMSATNAIPGISLIGSLVVAGANYSPVATAFGFVAVTCSSTNVVGGLLTTDWMLKMFKKGGEERAPRHFPEADIALAVGANDVTNPAAKPQQSTVRDADPGSGSSNIDHRPQAQSPSGLCVG